MSNEKKPEINGKDNADTRERNIRVTNWPKDNKILAIAPVLVSLVALGVSIASLNLSKESYVYNTRPYMNANSVVRNGRQNPRMVNFGVEKTAAKVKLMQLTISDDNNELFKWEIEDQIRFQTSNGNFSRYTIPRHNFDSIMSLSHDNSNIFRRIKIIYSDLDENRLYHFDLTHKLDPRAGIWRYEKLDAN